MFHKCRHITSLLVVLLVAMVLQPVLAQQDKTEKTVAATPKQASASFNFKNAQPGSVLEALEQLYGVPFVTDVPLKDRITLTSGSDVPLKSAVELLDAVLRRQGATARIEGGAVRIMPLSLATARVELIKLKYANPTEVAKLIEKLFRSRDLLANANQQNLDLINKLISGMDKEKLSMLSGKLEISAVPYPRLKAVIIRAPEAVIGAIKQFIQTELDKPTPGSDKPKTKTVTKPKAKPAPTKTRMYKLNFVPADHVVSMAKKLLGITPIIESRTNTLVLRGNNESQFNELADLVAVLDVAESMLDQTYYITLNNATASEVKAVLDKLFAETQELPYTSEGLEQLDKTQRGGRRSNVIMQGPTMMNDLQEIATARKEQAKETLVDVESDSQGMDFLESNFGVPFGGVFIVADEANNALLVRTNSKNIDMIANVVRQLDRPRRQVYIRVFIAEVRLDDTIQVGVDFIYNNVKGDKTVQYGFNLDARTDAESGTAGLTYSFISNNIDAFFRLIQTTSRLDVISTPNILTLDNQEATIEFGQQVPLLQTTSVTTEGGTTSTVNYEDVTTKLVVTPHINEAGFIRMSISQNVDSIGTDTYAITSEIQPQILITRKATTNLRVRDGQTVCIGGFVEDSIDESEKKVPFLGDIPYIGKAFTNTSKQRVKSELLIFITPYILDTPQELLSMTNDVRSKSIVAKRGGEFSDEMQIRDKPRPNPYAETGKVRNTYVLPPALREHMEQHNYGNKILKLQPYKARLIDESTNPATPIYLPQATPEETAPKAEPKQAEPAKPVEETPKDQPPAAKPPKKPKSKVAGIALSPEQELAVTVGMPRLFGE